MAGKPRDASVTTLVMDERVVYLVQHHVQPKRDHYVPAHCNAMVFPPPLQHLLHQFVRRPNPSSEIISQRFRIRRRNTDFTIPAHPALKQKPSQSNIRTMSASEHPAFRCKILIEHLSSSSRGDFCDFAFFVILDEVVFPKVDKNCIVSD